MGKHTFLCSFLFPSVASVHCAPIWNAVIFLSLFVGQHCVVVVFSDCCSGTHLENKKVTEKDQSWKEKDLLWYRCFTSEPERIYIFLLLSCFLENAVTFILVTPHSSLRACNAKLTPASLFRSFFFCYTAIHSLLNLELQPHCSTLLSPCLVFLAVGLCQRRTEL